MTTNASLDSILSYDYIDNCISIAGAALMIYDHAVTLDQEVSIIWRRKRTGVSVLFILNRIIGIIIAASMIGSTLNISSGIGPLAIEMLLDGSSIFQRAVYAAFASLRVYAIAGRSWIGASAVLVLNLLSLALHLYVFSMTPKLAVDIVTDPSTLQAIEDKLHRLAIVNVGGYIASDFIVLLVTWCCTYRIKREALSVQMEAPLATLLLKDGTMYFAVITLLEIAYFVLYFLNIYVGIEFVVYAMTTTTTSRFILALRNINNSDADATQLFSRPSFVASEVRFASAPGVMGNIGAPLESAFLSDDATDEEFLDVPGAERG